MTFINNDTHIIELYRIMNLYFGNNWFNWLPDTIWYLLKDKLKQGEDLSQKIKDKICALQLLLTTNRPWVEFEIFEKVSTALANKNVNPLILEPLEPEDAFIGLSILNYLRPNEKYSDETLIYITACFRQHGLISYGNSKDLDIIKDHFKKSLSKENIKIYDEINVNFNRIWGLSDNNLCFNDKNIIEVQLRKIIRIYKITKEYLKNYMVI